LFGKTTSLEDLGIVLSTPLLLLHGPFVLKFPENESEQEETEVTERLHGPMVLKFRERAADLGALQGVVALSELDLERASRIETPALRILTIENTKTTFHQFASANRDRSTLVIGAAGATTPVRLLISKLQPALPHFHFGDTDPNGYQILLQLRTALGREVTPFRMEYRPEAASPLLTSQQRQLAEKLKEEPQVSDVRAELEKMLEDGRLGQFEQESLGPPKKTAWPFF
jgi:hypothetical protein